MSSGSAWTEDAVRWRSTKKPTKKGTLPVTSFAQTQRKTSTTAPFIAAIALAAAVFGGAVGTAVSTIVDSAGAPAPALSVHDLQVLKQAQEWEARYRAMYPESIRPISVHDVQVLEQAQAWEARYRAMYPNSR
jgi:hypothetical protein